MKSDNGKKNNKPVTELYRVHRVTRDCFAKKHCACIFTDRVAALTFRKETMKSPFTRVDVRFPRYPSENSIWTGTRHTAHRAVYRHVYVSFLLITHRPRCALPVIKPRRTRTFSPSTTTRVRSTVPCVRGNRIASSADPWYRVRARETSSGVQFVPVAGGVEAMGNIMKTRRRAGGAGANDRIVKTDLVHDHREISLRTSSNTWADTRRNNALDNRTAATVQPVFWYGTDLCFRTGLFCFLFHFYNRTRSSVYKRVCAV